MSLRKQTPSDFLRQIIGQPVVVKLNSVVDYQGVLAWLCSCVSIAQERGEGDRQMDSWRIFYLFT
uniref:U6 snRNA-associated Sm-like protein LSm6 n=1 Tax=Jaculus jaculus TaxID=51337 RepID=UPI001E1B35DD|nr:U6 snRNA-associated Sm-like protein LSm6 [Jaculus jaculus]